MNNIVKETTIKALNIRTRNATKNLEDKKLILTNLEKAYKNKSHGVDYTSTGIGVSMAYYDDSVKDSIEEVKSSIENLSANIEGYKHALEQLADDNKLDDKSIRYIKKALKITSKLCTEQIGWYRATVRTSSDKDRVEEFQVKLDKAMESSENYRKAIIYFN